MYGHNSGGHDWLGQGGAYSKGSAVIYDNSTLDFPLQQTSFIWNFPFPAWITDHRDGYRIVAVNDAYSSEYGVEADPHSGAIDLRVWDGRGVDQFKHNDEWVISRRKPACFDERIKHPVHGRVQTLQVFKWPLITDSGRVIGVGGFVWNNGEMGGKYALRSDKMRGFS